MRNIMESVFDIAYLFVVVTMGLTLVTRAGRDTESRLFGIMALVLGIGDAFHLIPRIYALNAGGPEAHAALLGVGKAVTSVTMTVFYVLLYLVWKRHYHVNTSRLLDAAVGVLAAARVVLSLFPQNQWLVYRQPLDWAIYRNIPFALLGVLMIALFFRGGRFRQEHAFKWMWLAILLSFGFYAPVVLWGNVNETIGLLMIPKTLAYVWIVWMGYQNFRERLQKS
ncbi:MAG: hypothetical protein NTW63_02440 [Caldiserica bacterium]|jgi:hypothetical protein|nr:hypothetical protein [Caldisericota bacterium]